MKILNILIEVGKNESTSEFIQLPVKSQLSKEDKKILRSALRRKNK